VRVRALFLVSQNKNEIVLVSIDESDRNPDALMKFIVWYYVACVFVGGGVAVRLYAGHLP
jgi:hypothetical protein